MGAVIEVKYFNSFVLKKVGVANNNIIWDGSQGIPSNVAGGYPVVAQTPAQFNANDWAIEEARIRGGYNNTSTDYGAKAYLVEEEPNAVTRFNTLIYSGIFNSRTGINNTNVFSTADDITKSADPANGSIQKLYAEDTNLVIFQERKVSRALVDKDAIYAAEGGGAVTASNLTIGVIQPYAGKYGISKNPESFAIYGYHKYFADKENNAILRLSRSGIDEISAIGMKDFFRDNLNNLNTNAGVGPILGAYDIYNNQYVTSLQQYSEPLVIPTTFNTLSFDESIRGWTSRYSYAPQVMFSLGANFYSVQKDPNGVLMLWKHYSTTTNRGNFYGVNAGSNVTFILNVDPVRSKTFKTIGYEGSNGWRLLSLQSDGTGKNLNPSTSALELYFDQSSGILSYYEGEYAFNSAGIAIPRANYGLAVGANPPGFGTVNPPVPRYYAGFNRKENKYVSNLVNFSAPMPGEIVFGQNVSGIKGYFVTGTMATDTTTDLGGEKQLFSIESAYTMNNGY
tara:strand:+ start:1010 stop:2536 length:1527 start_codon:yes stop_codon:yes gene_type:complete